MYSFVLFALLASMQAGAMTLAQVEAEGFHVTREPSLPVADVGQQRSQPFAAPLEPGPILEFVDVHSQYSLRRLWPIFSA